MTAFAPFRSGLRARFVAVAGLLITTTVVSGLYSMVSFERLESFVDQSLRGSVTASTTVADLTSALEQEDDEREQRRRMRELPEVETAELRICGGQDRATRL